MAGPRSPTTDWLRKHGGGLWEVNRINNEIYKTMASLNSGGSILGENVPKVKIGYTVIVPGQLVAGTGPLALIRQIIRREFTKLWHEGKKEFRKVTRSWEKKNRPYWQRKSETKGGGLTISYGTGGVFKHLDAGTVRRWAVMQSDYKAKTVPRKFGSFGPGGVPLITGRSYMARHNIPRKPGIKPRRWTEVVAQDLQKKAERRFNKDIVPEIIKHTPFWKDVKMKKWFVEL